VKLLLAVSCFLSINGGQGTRAGSALWEVDKMGLLLILLSYYALNSIFGVENGDGSATTQIVYFSH